jgi:hypothetical protein
MNLGTGTEAEPPNLFEHRTVRQSLTALGSGKPLIGIEHRPRRVLPKDPQQHPCGRTWHHSKLPEPKFVGN